MLQVIFYYPTKFGGPKFKTDEMDREHTYGYTESNLYNTTLIIKLLFDSTVKVYLLFRGFFEISKFSSKHVCIVY